MVNTQEEIIKALQVIKDECDEILANHSCTDCPFSGAVGSCIFETKIPKKWNIKPREATWKAFGD